MDTVRKYAKFVVASVGAILLVLLEVGQAAIDGGMLNDEAASWVRVAIVVAAAFGVRQVRNVDPTPSTQ